MLRTFRRYVGSVRARRRYRRIYDAYTKYTMIPEDDYVANLALARTAAHVPGAVVECGVWRGGMIAGLADVLGPDREYVLCDSFAGLPPAKEIDGPAALRWQKNTTSASYYDNCTAPLDVAKEAMSLSRAKRVTFVPGWFEQTLPQLTLDDSIAILRLDGDWYESTITCLSNLAPKVREGGLILIDDYHTWDGCSRAVHDYLSSRKASWRISQYNNRLCYIRIPVPRAVP